MSRSTVKQCAIFDLDGTLANDKHRKGLLPNQYFKEHREGDIPQQAFDNYHEAHTGDVTIPQIATLLRSLWKANIGIVIMTSRPSKYRETTEAWLEKNDLPYDHMFMRNCSKASADLKMSWYNDHITQLYGRDWDSVLFAIDDYAPVVSMWRSIGIHCLHTFRSINPSVEPPDREPYNQNSFFPKHDAEASTLVGEDVVPELRLGDLRDLFAERNASYGTSYYKHGRLMKGLFPEGVKLETEADFARFGTLSMMVVKLSRYSRSFSGDGHQDSLDDLAVYATIMAELDSCLKGQKMKDILDDEGNFDLPMVEHIRKRVIHER